MSKTKITCHFVFGTKNRRATLISEKRFEVYKFMHGILKNLGCHPIKINGIEDHVHILTEISPTISISDILKKVKQSSSHWIKETNLIPFFQGWGRGYFAVSVSPQHVVACSQYIKNQELHHRGKAYADEIKSLIEELGMEWFPNEWE